jgi:hypothetical protein
MPELMARGDYIETETIIAAATIIDWVIYEHSPTPDELQALHAILTSHSDLTHEALESPTRCEGKFKRAQKALVDNFEAA